MLNHIGKYWKLSFNVGKSNHGRNLELSQSKNDSIWSKDKVVLKLPRSFTRLYRRSYQDIIYYFYFECEASKF